MLNRRCCGLWALSFLGLVAGHGWAQDGAGTAFTPAVVGERDLSDVKGIKKVAIASFVVQYVSAQTTTGGGAVIDFSDTLLAEPARLQTLTEAMYRDLQTSVTAAGFELVPHTTLLATPEYKAMQEKTSATPLLMETGSPGSKSGAYKSHFYTPQGLVLNLKGDDFDNLRKDYTGFSSIADDTLTFAGRLAQYSTNWTYYDKALQKATGAATLHVRVFIPVAYIWSGSQKVGTWTHYTSGAMAAVRLGQRFTRMAVGHEGNIAKLYLTEDLMTKGLTEAKLVRETTNLFGTVTGREVDYKLNLQAYEQLIPVVVDHTMKAFLARIKSAS